MIIKETKDKLKMYFKNILTYAFMILVFLTYTFKSIQALNKADTFVLDNIYGTALILNIYIIAIPFITYLNIYILKELFEKNREKLETVKSSKIARIDIFSDTFVVSLISLIPFICIYIFNYFTVKLNFSFKHLIYTYLLILIYSFLNSCILNIVKNMKKIKFKKEIFLVLSIICIFAFTNIYLLLKGSIFNFEFNMMYIKFLENLKSIQDILILVFSLSLIYALSVKYISRRISNED